MTRPINRGLGSAFAALMLAGSVAATPAAAQQTPQSGGTMNILVKQLPAEMGNVKTTFAAGTTGNIFPVVETLVGVDPEHGYVPSKLATAWEIADDARSITFTLREGVKFHDGTDFNAEAVKWNIEQSLKQGALGTVDSIEVLDAYTIKLNLKQPDNTILNALSWYDGVMISPASVEGQTPQFTATNIIGTGPFVLSEVDGDQKISFTRFDGYWDAGKPYLDSIAFIAVPDQNTAKTAFLSGQANVWDYVDDRNVPDLKERGYHINTSPGLGRIMYPDSENADSPYAKVEVRQAFEYAIDKQAIADAFGYGTWSVMNGPCADIHMGCEAIGDAARGYDPQKARDLLAAAGYPNGFETTIYSVRSIDDEMLTAMQAYLADVGIMAEMLKPDPATGAALHAEGWKNALFLQGMTTDSPSYAAALQTDGPVPVSKAPVTLVPDEYHTLVDAALAATDEASEREASAKLARFVHDEAIFVPLVVAARNAALAPEVHTDLEAFSVHFWNPADSWIEQQ